MTGKQTLLLSDRDFILRGDGEAPALREMFRHAWDRAGATVLASGAEYTDRHGEIRRRTWRLVFGEDVEDITIKQRRFLHAAVFPQIAEQVAVDGVRFTSEVWKEFYRRKFLGDRWVSQRLPGQKRAVPVKRRVSTEDLDIRQYSEHIDKVIDDAVVEYGVRFDLNPRDREDARWKPSQRKPRAQQQTEEAPA